MDNSVKKALSEYIGSESEAVTYEVELGAVIKFAKCNDRGEVEIDELKMEV